MTLDMWNRRSFLSTVGALTLPGVATVLHAAEPPPETTKIRLTHTPAICFAPQYLAEELLRLEGFSEVEYVPDKIGRPMLLVGEG